MINVRVSPGSLSEAEAIDLLFSNELPEPQSKDLA